MSERLNLMKSGSSIFIRCLGIWAVAYLLAFSSICVGRAQTSSPAALIGGSLPNTGPEADVLRSLEPYGPLHQVAGTIRLWGHGSMKKDFMGNLIRAWENGFSKSQPEVKYDYRMYGTASAIGALYERVGDVAILGEEINPMADAAFERKMRYPPLGIEIATGSLNVKNFEYAQVFFVHKDNPLSKLTLAQLDAIFGSEHRRGLANIRTWGQLGLTGEWADKPIHPYGWLMSESFCLYLEHALLNGSHRWNNDTKEFVTITRPDKSTYDDGQQILDALSSDRYGIAVSSLFYLKPGLQVKPLALAAQKGGPYYLATKETLIQRNYPLTRLIPAFINRPPGQPVDPTVKEFLRYILSRDGQADIVRSGGYLPLNKQAIEEQLRKLN